MRAQSIKCTNDRLSVHVFCGSRHCYRPSTQLHLSDLPALHVVCSYEPEPAIWVRRRHCIDYFLRVSLWFTARGDPVLFERKKDELEDLEDEPGSARNYQGQRDGDEQVCVVVDYLRVEIDD